MTGKTEDDIYAWLKESAPALPYVGPPGIRNGPPVGRTDPPRAWIVWVRQMPLEPIEEEACELDGLNNVKFIGPMEDAEGVVK